MKKEKMKLLMVGAAMMMLPANIWATPDGDNPPPPSTPGGGNGEPEDPKNNDKHKMPPISIFACSYESSADLLYIHFRRDLASATITILCDGITIGQDTLENIAAGTIQPYSLSDYGSGTFTVLLQTGGTAYLLGTFDAGE